MITESCKILLLTDNTELVELVNTVAAQSEYIIINANCLNKATKLFDINNIKMALIDANINDFQGLIKNIVKTKTLLNTILFYNEADFSFLRKKYKDVVDDFLEHPVRPNDLVVSFDRFEKYCLPNRSTIQLLDNKDINNITQDFYTIQHDYHQLFDSVPSYIAVLNKNKQITEINRNFKKDFGDQTGRSFFEVLKPGSLPVGEDPISKVMLDGASHQGEIVLTSEDGKQYNMMTWAVPILTSSGNIKQILTVLADKTETRNLKDNLSSLGLMLGTLSHNLKGSLTGLDAGLYLIDTGFYRDKAARIEEGLDVSKLMVDRIRKMIFNVLYYAKKRELFFVETNIRQFAGDVAAHVENRILGGNISFKCNFPQKDIFFNLDPDLLRSALINILENAREVCISDLTDKRYEITFKVFTDNDDLVFEVYDNGCGMDEEQQKQLFSIFSSSKGLKGTGLGLYITNEVIRKHNGTITVTSDPGVGTCFCIKLPNTLHRKRQ